MYNNIDLLDFNKCNLQCEWKVMEICFLIYVLCNYFYSNKDQFELINFQK